MTDTSDTFIPKKVIPFSAPLHIVEGVTWNQGETKYKFKGLKNIFIQMFYRLRSFFFESYTIGMNQTIVRESYLGIDEKGNIVTRTKPTINENEEELKKNIGMSIQMFEPVNEDARILRTDSAGVVIISSR